jgi:hypothetical protein
LCDDSDQHAANDSAPQTACVSVEPGDCPIDVKKALEYLAVFIAFVVAFTGDNWDVVAEAVVSSFTRIADVLDTGAKELLNWLADGADLEELEKIGRQAYEEEVKALAEEAEALRQEGLTESEIAERLVNARNELKRKYREDMKHIGLGERVKEYEKRNLELYGHPVGPSYEQLKRENKTDQEIIRKATTPGGDDLGY